jgi:DNA-binding CsgD family transcriptional regulator
MTEERSTNRGGTKPGEAAMPQPHGGAIGMKPHEVTDEKRRQVRELAGLQISQQEIADVMGISADTIQRHYSEDFHQGRAAFALKVRKHAFNLALGELVDPDKPELGYKAHFTPDRDMTKFVLRSQFGWEDTTKIRHEGGDPAKPLNVELTHIRRVVVDPKNPG